MSFRSSRITRREALERVAMTAACAAVAPLNAFAQGLTFPRGAIIRTLLKDYAPEELAGGATLFHEHMSLAPDFNDKFRAAAAAARAANGLPPLPGRTGGPPAPPAGADPMRDVNLMAEELATAKREGVACIVDGGHPDMGRDLDFVRQASMKSGVPVVAGAGLY
jgi:predicted metal-dependent phosphotriesterase family hydrolase